MVRGTGKFKQKRGGGRSFSKDMVFDNSEQARAARRGDVEGIEEDSDEESEESEEEDSDEDSEEESGDETKPGAELTRTERRELKKKEAAARAAKKTGGAGPSKAGDNGDEDDEDLINPNHVQKKLTFKDLEAPQQLSRREREQKEKEEAKLRYQKLHLAGKTDEAKSDMARLNKIRAEREAALAKRKAEAESKAKEADDKRQAQMKRK